MRPLDVDRAEHEIELLTNAYAVLFSSARGALAGAVSTLKPEGTVAVPGYTCIAVPNAVKSAGCPITYADVDSRGIVRSRDWPKVDLVVAQDTYGFPAELPPKRRIIRDASHRTDLAWDSLGSVTVAITSFEQSKWLSAGQGGLALTTDRLLAERLRAVRDAHSTSSPALAQALVTLLILVVGRLQYHGKTRLAYRLRRITMAVAADRLRGQCATELAGEGIDPRLRGSPSKVVARMIVSQLRRADEVAAHRSRIVAIYDRIGGVERPPEPLVRYPMWVDDPDDFERELRASGWDVSGRWFNAALHPVTADADSFGYRAGTAPNAERLASCVINLPTHPLVREDDAEGLIKLAIAQGASALQ
ncbi:MAG: DegT/DnrJ/EryC1/StrS family aminotransferase [Chloroflexota bacterium]|nr:DegT/DnrJ/EryC1/StrS family aminotransferase [Chloroflexota bacterium]